MSQGENEIFHEMEHANVVDMNGLDIGKICDFTFEDFKLKQFIVKGDNPVVLEWLKLDSRYSLLIPKENIRRIYKGEVHLSVPAKALKKITEIGEDEQRFVPMRSVDVFASDGEDLGKVTDAIFHVDDHFSLILGGTRFNQFMHRFGIGGESRLFVPFRYVDVFNTNIVRLNKDKSDLTTVINNIIMDSDGLKLRNQQELNSHDSRWELYNESLKDILRQNVRMQ